MPKANVTREAWLDIEVAQEVTLAKFGQRKLDEYNELIEEALGDILRNPSCGRILLPGAPHVRGKHIGKPGRRARHIVVYRATEDGNIDVLRFLHDAMDFGRHL